METIEQNSWFRIGVNDFRYRFKRNPVKVKHSPQWELWQAGYDSAEFNERYD